MDRSGWAFRYQFKTCDRSRWVITILDTPSGHLHLGVIKILIFILQLRQHQ
ncbi:hypothetical protein Hdeb2414_s0004g00133661 [Helianthus debilis subsp. tardiflorus]